MSSRDARYGLLADFRTPEALLKAARQTRDEGYRMIDAFTPYPVDGLGEALGVHRNYVPLIVLLGGLAGATVGFLMQYYASVVSYPLNVGGKPLNSWPMFMPVTFELTVLSAALCGLVGMIALNRLPMPYHPLFNVPLFDRASRDRFFLCIEAADPKFDPQGTREFLLGLDPEGVVEVPD